MKRARPANSRVVLSEKEYVKGLSDAIERQFSPLEAYTDAIKSRAKSCMHGE